MKHLTKTLFTVIAFTFLTLFLVSCDESLDQLAINEAIDAIELVFAEGDDIDSVTQDLTLPEEFGRVTITWQSGNTSVITDDGVVTRQRMDTSVTLIAVATYNALTATKSFVVTVLAADETPVIDILEDARASLLIPGVGNGVTQDIALPMTVGQEGVTVTWESSHPEIVADDGSLVFQPDENTSITMTATLHLEGESLTKVFNLVVIAAADVTHVQSIEEARDISTDEDGVVTRTYVLIPDVTILGITNDGVVFYDETGILFAYMGARRNDLVVGGVYNVRGLTDRYFGSWQVNNTADPARPVVFQASDAPATAIDPIVVASVTDMLANHETVSDTNPNLYYTYYRLTAKVRIQGTGNYDTVFVDPDYEGDNIPTDPNSPHATEGVMIYYQSNKAAFDAFDGVVITFDALFYSYRSDRTVFTILFLGTVNDIGLSLPDEEVLDLVQGSLESSFEDAYTLDTTLDLPTSLLGASIDWETDSPLVDLETGALTMPENAQETVTLTATATINGVERVITISFIAGELDIITLADARAADGKVRIQGVVTAQVDNRSFMIQDATGALAIYTSNEELIAALTAALGKEVDMVATRGDYNGLEQLSPISIEVLGDAPLPAARSITNVPFTAEDLLPFQAMLVSAEGLEVVSTATDQYNNIILMLKNANEEEIELRFDSRVVADTSFIETLVAGDLVNIVGAPLSWAYNAPRLYFTDFSQVTEAAYIPETDEEKVLLAADALDIPSEIGSDVTLVLPTDGLYGTSIAWNSDNAQIDATTGEVTVTGTTVVVTLTATVTLNAAEEVREFEVTVGYITQTVADARAAEVGTQLTIEATITAVSFDTSDRAVVFVQDDYEGIYLYKVPAEFKAHLAVGNTIKVTGSRAVYQNLVQLNNFVDVELVSEGNVTTPLLVTDPTMLPDYQGQLVSVTGYLKQTYTGTPSDYHLVTTEGQFALRLISGSDAPAAQRDTVYAALVGVPAGSEVTVVAGVGQYSTTMQIMLFEGSQITVGAVGADEDLLAVALANLELPQDGSTAELDLTLPTEGLFGITVVWSSDNEAVISTTGVINRPAPGESDASVVLGYTVFMGETELTTGTVTITVPAGAFPVSTLADARATESGTVRIQGVLTSKMDHRTFTVQDATGALAIYTSNADMIAALTAALGMEIDLVATRGGYNGLEQLSPVTLEVIGAGTMPAAASLDDVAFTPEALLPFQTMLVSATALEVVSNTTDGYSNIILILMNAAAEEIEVRYDSRNEGVDTSSLDVLVPGDMVNLVAAPLGWSNGARVYYTNPDQVTPYEADEPSTRTLIFSEYIEGGSFNKAIEIYNASGDTVDLSTYSVSLFSNGSSTAGSTFALSGTLAPGEIIILVHASATSDFKVGTYYETSVANWNGDDAIVLYNGEAVVDSFGQVGFDPGSSWSANGVVTANMTLVRAPFVTSGDTDPFDEFDPSLEWIAYPQDTFEYLGTHDIDPISDEPIEPFIMYHTGFEIADPKTSYALGTMNAGNQAGDNELWELDNALRGSLANDKKNDSWSVRGKANGTATLLQEYEGLHLVTFYWADYGTETGGILNLQFSVDGGVTWHTLASYSNNATLTMEFVYIDYNDPIITNAGATEQSMFMVRFEFAGVADKRMNIDDVGIFTLPPAGYGS